MDGGGGSVLLGAGACFFRGQGGFYGFCRSGRLGSGGINGQMVCIFGNDNQTGDTGHQYDCGKDQGNFQAALLCLLLFPHGFPALPAHIHLIVILTHGKSPPEIRMCSFIILYFSM